MSSDDDISDDPEDIGKVPGTFRDVQLHAARLGLTLENVLEATVVHDVDEDGAAKQAGLVADVLVVSVNGETTRGLLHDEVITLLRTPDRPLTLKVQDLDAGNFGATTEGSARAGFGRAAASYVYDE